MKIDEEIARSGRTWTESCNVRAVNNTAATKNLATRLNWALGPKGSLKDMRPWGVTYERQGRSTPQGRTFTYEGAARKARRVLRRERARQGKRVYFQ